ncbi:MAG TPA: hypothetical protein VMW80_01135 [Candidatus Dormibacteraeota bacterium]|nr:hypothetical protein [Candidatus Dormibacteraeota bacterium]
MPLPLRKGYRPPDDALVVRGGRQVNGDLQKAAELCEAKHGVLGVSAFVAEVDDVASLVDLVPEALRHEFLGVSSVGQVRQHFDLLPSFHAPHYTIVLPDLDPGTFAILRTVLTIEPNPRFRGKPKFPRRGTKGR